MRISYQPPLVWSECPIGEVIAAHKTIGGALGAAGGRRAHVLVNNRAERNVPLTVEGLVGMLRI